VLPPTLDGGRASLLLDAEIAASTGDVAGARAASYALSDDPLRGLHVVARALAAAGRPKEAQAKLQAIVAQKAACAAKRAYVQQACRALVADAERRLATD
jgi:hypothetical protein